MADRNDNKRNSNFAGRQVVEQEAVPRMQNVSRRKQKAKK